MSDLWGRLFGWWPRNGAAEADGHAEAVEALVDRGERERARACRVVSAWDREEGAIQRIARERVSVTDTLLRARDRGREAG